MKLLIQTNFHVYLDSTPVFSYPLLSKFASDFLASIFVTTEVYCLQITGAIQLRTFLAAGIIWATPNGRCPLCPDVNFLVAVGALNICPGARRRHKLGAFNPGCTFFHLPGVPVDMGAFDPHGKAKRQARETRISTKLERGERSPFLWVAEWERTGRPVHLRKQTLGYSPFGQQLRVWRRKGGEVQK